jgi:hypothetical protein
MEVTEISQSADSPSQIPHKAYIIIWTLQPHFIN